MDNDSYEESFTEEANNDNSDNNIHNSHPVFLLEEIDTKVKYKKRKNNEPIKLSTITPKIDTQNIIRTFKLLMNEYTNKENFPITPIEKEAFIKYIMPSVKNILISQESEAYSKFIQTISNEFSINKQEISLLIKFELFAYKIDNLFSTFCRFLNQLVLYLCEIDMHDFTEVINNLKEGDSILKIRLDSTIYRFLSYKKLFNDYYGKIYNKQDKINETLEKYIPDINKRKKEYLYRISNKIKEQFTKSQIGFDFKDLEKYITANFQDNELDDNKSKINFSIEDFFAIKKENKTNNAKNIKGNQNQPEMRNHNKTNRLIENKITKYRIQQEPIKSKRFYICEFSPFDFTD